MRFADLLENLTSTFGTRLLETQSGGLEPYVRVASADWPDLARHLRDRCGLDYLACLTSVDRGDGLEAIYHVERMDAGRLGIAVRISVPYDAPEIPSVAQLWRTADWHEREAFDLMGIRFPGHPNLKRILCAEDWVGHPLRKDYQSPDYYHGIRNNVV